MSAKTDIKPLRSVPLFDALDDDQLGALAGVFEFQKHPDGFVFGKTGRQGRREQDTLYVILEGEVSVSTKPGTEKQVAVQRRMRAGEMFGLISFLKGGPRTATTKAAGPVHVAALTFDRYEQIVRKDPKLNSAFLFAVAGQLARDVRACNQRLVKAVGMSGEA